MSGNKNSGRQTKKEEIQAAIEVITQDALIALANSKVYKQLNKIKEDNPQLAIICDIRFPNEIEEIHKIKGKVIKFTRQPYKDDEHNSEKALDNYTDYDAVVDNKKMTIAEQNEVVTKQLIKWKYLPWKSEVEVE